MQGIEASLRGEIGVRSLQEWASDLRALRGASAMPAPTTRAATADATVPTTTEVAD